jgi:hypothetical protein
MLPALIPQEDADASKELANQFRRRGITLHLSSQCTKVEGSGSELTAHLSNGETVVADLMLVSTGRRPLVDRLGLKGIGIEFDPRTGVATDPRRRTTVPHIYAVGDCAGYWQLAHTAFREGEVAAQNACGHQAVVGNRAVPRPIYTEPEIASVSKQHSSRRCRRCGSRAGPYAPSFRPVPAAAAVSLALGEDLLETSRVGLDVHPDLPHCAIGVPGADGGQDRFVLGQDHARVLELAVLHREHHQVEPELPDQLGVELIEPGAVQQRDDRGVERQVLVGDPPRVVRSGGLDERVEGLTDRRELFRGGYPRDCSSLQPFPHGAERLDVLRVGEMTTAPRFTSYRTRPLSSRMRTASRTVLRATPSSVAIALSRSRSPGAKAPTRIRSDRPSATCCAVWNDATP